MVPTNTQKQQELFPDLAIVEKRKSRFFRAFKFKKPIFPQHRLSFSLSYEALIIILIGMVLAISVVFSLGVERGRNLEFPEASSSAATQGLTVATAGVPVTPSVPLLAEKPVAEKGPAKKAAEAQKQQLAVPERPQEPVKAASAPKPAASVSEAKPFTIQVASYKARNLAEKEVAILKSKGYSSEIIKKGDYFILCVGSYAKKELAQKAASGLSRMYKGCYVRKR